MCSRLEEPTEGVREVLLAHQLHVVVYGLGGQGVLSEDQGLLLSEALHLSTSQVEQELLEKTQHVTAEAEDATLRL